MATIKINELPTSSINSTDFLVKADGNGLATKNTVENLLAPLQTNINNVEQSLEDNVQDEQDARIAADTTLQNNIDLKVNISSIVNNVTAGGSSVPLSAEQGKLLKAEILALAGSLIPQGNWNADTNTPDISGTTETGYYWIVSVSGSTDLGGETDWKVNDWAIKTADGFAKIDNTDKVISVAGKIGDVVLNIADITSLQSGLDGKANLSGGNTFEGSQIFNNSTIGSLNKIIINNSINDSGLEVNNTDDDGFGLNINNTSTGIGSRTVNEIGGIGSFFVNNQDSFTEGNAIEILNKGLGNSIFINNDTSGNGFVSNASDSETTGLNFVGQNETVNTFTVDKEGNVVGLSFSGDGSLLTNMPVSSAQQTALDLKANKASPSFTGNATFGGDVEIDNGGSSYITVKRSVSGSEGTILVGASTNENAILSRDSSTGSKKLSFIIGTSSAYDIEANGNHDFKSGDATFGGDVIIDGGVGVASSALLHIRQKGDGISDGISVTSSNAASSRIWKDAAGVLNLTTAGGVGLGIDNSGNATFGGSVQADSYKSSDGSVGETQTVDVGNDTSLVFKNGILTEVVTP